MKGTGDDCLVWFYIKIMMMMNDDNGNLNYAQTTNFNNVLLLHRSCNSPVDLNAYFILQIERLGSLKSLKLHIFLTKP